MNNTHKNKNKRKNKTVKQRQLGNNGIKQKCIDSLVKQRMEIYKKMKMEVFNEKEKLYRKILKNKYSLHLFSIKMPIFKKIDLL